MTKHLKHLKTFEFHSSIMCAFFFRWIQMGEKFVLNGNELDHIEIHK